VSKPVFSGDKVVDWHSELHASKDFVRRARLKAWRKRKLFFSYTSSLKIIFILLLSFYAFRLPPIGTLPHADVLVLDMTRITEHSPASLYGLLDAEGLSYVIFHSMNVQDIRLLPSGGYKYIIIWAHAGINDMASTERFSPFYHIAEQLTGQIGRYQVGGKEYFSIRPGLIDGIVGSFHSTTIMLMGCNTVTQPGLAESFIRKGASMVIGWRGLVTLPITDMVMVKLFDGLLRQNLTAGNAVSQTSALLTSMGMASGLSEYS